MRFEFEQLATEGHIVQNYVLGKRDLLRGHGLKIGPGTCERLEPN